MASSELRGRKMIKKCLICIIALACSSCATSYLWGKTDPEEYVAMKLTPDSEKHLHLHKLQYLVDAKRNVIYVEKSKIQKLGDYAVRTLATPVTVTLDATTSIAIIGVVFYGMSRQQTLQPQQEPAFPKWFCQLVGSIIPE